MDCERSIRGTSLGGGIPLVHLCTHAHMCMPKHASNTHTHTQIVIPQIDIPRYLQDASCCYTCTQQLLIPEAFHTYLHKWTCTQAHTHMQTHTHNTQHTHLCRHEAGYGDKIVPVGGPLEVVHRPFFRKGHGRGSVCLQWMGVFVWMCMCECVSVYVPVCVRVCVYECVCMSVCENVCTCVYVLLCTCVHVCMYSCVHVCTYVFLCKCRPVSLGNMCACVDVDVCSEWVCLCGCVWVSLCVYVYMCMCVCTCVCMCVCTCVCTCVCVCVCVCTSGCGCMHML